MTELTADYHLKDIQITENSVSCTVFLPDNLVYFDGHFDEFPLLPAVVQIHWVMGLAKQYFKTDVSHASLPLVKFMNMIRPESEITIALSYDKNIGKIEFTYHKDEKIYSKGTIKL